MDEHGLDSDQLAILKEVLAPYSDRIEQVKLFGSRATGHAKPYSDIDLVLYGSLDNRTVDRIRTMFNESALAIKVDVEAYHHIAYPALKHHIDTVAKPLFFETELMSGRKSPHEHHPA